MSDLQLPAGVSQSREQVQFDAGLGAQVVLQMLSVLLHGRQCGQQHVCLFLHAAVLPQSLRPKEHINSENRRKPWRTWSHRLWWPRLGEVSALVSYGCFFFFKFIIQSSFHVCVVRWGKNLYYFFYFTEETNALHVKKSFLHPFILKNDLDFERKKKEKINNQWWFWLKIWRLHLHASWTVHH